MIRLGLRLAVAGGREAMTRLVIITAAVGVGTALLLAALAGINAIHAQNVRFAWLTTGTAPEQNTAAKPLWWLLRLDYFDGKMIDRVDVAATGPDSPVPPGIPRLPGPGEFYASPALSSLLTSTPAAQLADRFPGHQIGTIGRAALPDPTSLVIVVGHSPELLARVPGAKLVSSIGTTPPESRAAALTLVLSVVAGGMLFPVLIFIGTATRLTATRREQRFAAIRLVGATPRQVSVLAAVESTAAAMVGTGIGFILFLSSQQRLAAVRFTGAPFYPGDMRLDVADVLLVGLGIPLGAAAASWVALRRVRISPLGVTRRVTPRAPRPYRLIPLLMGIGELGYFIGRRPDTSNGQAAAFLSGFLLIMVGLIAAGPWLTMVGARVLARRSSRPATLIAARRLADNPQAGFRAISGVVLALFVTSAAVGVITTIVTNRGGPRDGTATSTTLSQTFWRDEGASGAVPDAVSADLHSTPGVQVVTVVRRNPTNPTGTKDIPPGVVACHDLARAPELGRCPHGAAVAMVWPGATDPDALQGQAPTWPAASVSARDLRRLPILSIVVRTDGSTQAIEQARTVLEVAYPNQPVPPSTEGDIELDFVQTLAAWRRLADVVILASLAIGGCSLAASVAGGLSERKRPFSLLRLSGVPLYVLRRVIALESAVPLVIAAAVATGAGFLAAHLFLKAQMDYTVHAPGAAYYITVLTGLAASLGIVASTFPLLQRITGPETARNE